MSQITLDVTDDHCKSGEYGDDAVVDVLIQRYIEVGELRLTAVNARRLAAALMRAADELDAS